MTDYKIPKELLYSKDNSWVKIDGDIALIGIHDVAAKKVREFVFIDLPQNNKQINNGEIYVSLESIKWSGHLTSPLSGDIIEVNEELFDDPGLINQDPYENWIIRLRFSDKSELDNLMDAEEFEKSLS